MGSSNSSNVHQQTPVSGGGEGRDETLDILQQVIHKYSRYNSSRLWIELDC